MILIDGGVRAIPPVIAKQLNPDGGRLVTVLIPGSVTSGGQGVLAEAGRHTAADGVLRPQPAFDCATPLLLPLLPAPAFRF